MTIQQVELQKNNVEECIFDYIALHIEQKLTPPVGGYIATCEQNVNKEKE